MPNLKKSFVVFSGLLLGFLALAVIPTAHLFSFAYKTGEQSYILLIPAITAGLIYRDRANIFSRVGSTFARTAGIGFAFGALLIAIAYLLPGSSEGQLAVTALGLVIFSWADFAACFGGRAARAAAFPLGMLLWTIPIPQIAITGITVALQQASTETVDGLFRLTGVPVLRNGFVFALPGQSIEVAKACSGIRSSLSLIVLTLILAHESLHSNWRRLILVHSTLPIVVLKNGVRIVSLTLLAIYVDPSFLTGSLHHDGGIVFFLIGLVMLVPILALLRRGDITELSVSDAKAQAASGGRG